MKIEKLFGPDASSRKATRSIQLKNSNVTTSCHLSESNLTDQNAPEQKMPRNLAVQRRILHFTGSTTCQLEFMRGRVALRDALTGGIKHQLSTKRPKKLGLDPPPSERQNEMRCLLIFVKSLTEDHGTRRLQLRKQNLEQNFYLHWFLLRCWKC